MSLLEVQHLRKSYGHTRAVDDLSFEVAEGEVFGLLGPNGAGKSTTMLILAGLLRADSGTVRINGREFNAHDGQMRSLLGVVPQDLAIYTDLSAHENLKFFGRLYGLNGSRLTSRIAVALEQTGLTDQAHNPVRTYSGGMKRRLNFGIAVLHEPRLLILDEPTVGVDPQSRSHLLECIRQLSAAGIGVLYASHYMDEVEAICHRVAIMDHGRMLACDGLRGLLGRLRPDLRLLISDCPPALIDRLRGMAEVRATSGGEATIIVAGSGELARADLTGRLTRVMHLLGEHGVELCAVEAEESNLERLFLELTGHRLRD